MGGRLLCSDQALGSRAARSISAIVARRPQRLCDIAHMTGNSVINVLSPSLIP